MPRVNELPPTVPTLLKQVAQLRASLAAFDRAAADESPNYPLTKRFVAQTGALVSELQRARERVSPVRFGTIGITLGRSDSIAKFFAFSFTNQEKRPLDSLLQAPFYGAGVYAIYYHGNTEKVKLLSLE